MAAISKQERTGVDNECFQETDMDVEKKLPFNSCLKDAEMISDPQSNNNTSDKLHRVLGIRLHGSLLGPKWLLTFLCMAALVQGMIFTNVVISSLEKRFGLQSTTSGIIAGAYDMGSLIAVIPVTYFGGRPGASKPKYIAWGMFIVGTGSLIFSSPHFITDKYIYSLEINSTKSGKGYSDVLCHSGEEEESLVNTTFSNLLPGSFESEFIDLSLYKYVFLLGQLLHGIGSAALITLGTTLLDGSVKKSSVPLYIGILNACFVIGPAFGFLVGGQFLNVFTEFYLVSVEHLNIDTASPKWVGAWWIGFLLIVVMSYLCAFLIGLYPARIPGCEESEVNKLASESSSISDEFVVNTCDFGKISELPRAILYLLSNATYACISLGATMDGFLLAALAAFMPKYMESQFGLTPGYAAILIGILIVPAGAGGSLLGGFIVKFYEFTRTQSIAMYIVCQLAILPLYLGFLLYCPNPPFAGVNSAYPHVPYNEQLSLSAGCNTNCSANCDVLSYMPVCGENGVSYFNPCYAGCKSNGTNGILRDCLCIDGPESIALEGVCPSNCNYLPFSALFFFQIFFTFLATMPGLVASLRSVEPLYRSLSLGLQTILVRGFGTVPGPIIFGLILDKSCLLWNDRDSGNCLLYDNYWSSRLIFGVLIIWRLVGAIFFIFAYFQSKKSKLADS